MDDDFGADADFLEALAASSAPTRPQPPKPRVQQQQQQRVQQPVPQKAQQQQPTPQRLDRPVPASASGPKTQQQPTPQALPQRSSGSAIQVSPRQRGNPVLASIRSTPWEYSDIPADYVLGTTTCALFLSLKYHRLHPEYIYQRIRNLQGKYNLRLILTMVDITNHEDPLRELTKTSVVNNVTIVLCWSAVEAARYLEMYKSYEKANFSAIRGQQSSTYAEKLVDFVTVPRSVNKADAIALVSSFGSLRDAINADPEQIGSIAGWGSVKVNKWVGAVDEPFRARKAAKRKRGDADGVSVGVDGGGSGAGSGTATPRAGDDAVPIGRVPLREMSSSRGTPGPGAPAHRGLHAQASSGARSQSQSQLQSGGVDGLDEYDEEDLIAAAMEESKRTAEAEASQRANAAGGSGSSQRNEDQLSEGILAELAKLQKQN